MHTRTFLPLLGFVFILAGCATTYHDPGTSALSPSGVAILEEPASMDPFVYISEVNGKDRGTGFFTRYILPPGRNTVVVVGNTHGGMYENPTLLAFVAKAGGVYVMKYDSGPNAHLWKPSSWNGPATYKAWIEEKTSGERIDETSLQEKMKKAEPNKHATDNSGLHPFVSDLKRRQRTSARSTNGQSIQRRYSAA